MKHIHTHTHTQTTRPTCAPPLFKMGLTAFLLTGFCSFRTEVYQAFSGGTNNNRAGLRSVIQTVKMPGDCTVAQQFPDSAALRFSGVYSNIAHNKEESFVSCFGLAVRLVSRRVSSTPGWLFSLFKNCGL